MLFARTEREVFHSNKSWASRCRLGVWQFVHRYSHSSFCWTRRAFACTYSVLVTAGNHQRILNVTGLRWPIRWAEIRRRMIAVCLRSQKILKIRDNENQTHLTHRPHWMFQHTHTELRGNLRTNLENCVCGKTGFAFLARIKCPRRAF